MSSEQESSGCLSFILLMGLIFLIGLGSCVLMIVKAEFETAQEQKVEDAFLEKISQKIQTTDAEPLEIWLFAQAMKDDETDAFKQNLADKKLIDASENDEHLYQKYLLMAANAGSPEAQLEYADYLYDKNDDELSTQHAGVAALEQVHQMRRAISLVEKAVLKQCTFFNANLVRYPDLHRYYETEQFNLGERHWIDKLHRVLEKTNIEKYDKLTQDASLVLLYNLKHCEKETLFPLSKNNIAQLVYAHAAERLIGKKIPEDVASSEVTKQPPDSKRIDEKVTNLLKAYRQRYGET